MPVTISSEAPPRRARPTDYRPLPHGPKAALAIAMAWTAGFANVVGWLFLYRVHISGMTGTTNSLGASIVNGNLGEAFRYGWVLLFFVVGLLYGAWVSELAQRRGIHIRFSIVTVSELVLFGCFVGLGLTFSNSGTPAHVPPLVWRMMVACLTAGLGMQTLTVTRVSGLRVFTTYVTGSLAKSAENFVKYLFWLVDRTRGRFRSRMAKAMAVTGRNKYAIHALLTLGLWAGFFGGAICGAVGYGAFGIPALGIPMGLLAVTILVDLARPVAAADEKSEIDSAH